MQDGGAFALTLPKRLAGLFGGVGARKSDIPQVALAERHQLASGMGALAPFDERRLQLTPTRQATRTNGCHTEGHHAHGLLHCPAMLSKAYRDGARGDVIGSTDVIFWETG